MQGLGLPYDARGDYTWREIGGQPVVMKYLYNYLDKISNAPVNILQRNSKWFLFRQTQLHLRFAEAVEPENGDVRARTAREREKRDRGEPTLPSTIGEELATNPFLRAGLTSVASAATKRAGRPMNGAVDAFATLREWKNGFQ